MKSKRIVLSILVLLFAAGTAHAASNRGSASDLPVFLQSPAERMQEWREGLLDFTARRPNLTSEQVAAIQELGDLDLEFFASKLDANTKARFEELLGELGSVLSHGLYLKVLSSFNAEVRGWLVENELVKLEEATKECNCDSRQDCGGNLCDTDATCLHIAGTSHYGRCTGTELEL